MGTGRGDAASRRRDRAITSIEKLKGHTVGVVGGEINHRLVDDLKKEYDLGADKVTFKDHRARRYAARAIQAKEVSALLLVVPLDGTIPVAGARACSAKTRIRRRPLIPIDSAGAIADVDARL